MNLMRVVVFVHGMTGFELARDIVFPSGVLSLTGTSKALDSAFKPYITFIRGGRYPDAAAAKAAIPDIFAAFRDDFLEVLRQADDAGSLEAVEWRIMPNLEVVNEADFNTPGEPVSVLPYRVQIRARFSLHLRNDMVNFQIAEAREAA